jgi:hypothetical protein
VSKTAIVVLLSSLFFAGLLLPTVEEADHSGSPAFSASLERAISQLEGALVEVTAAANPDDGAMSAPLTIGTTCDISDPICGEHTRANTCEVTVDPTCQCEETSDPGINPECEPTFDTCVGQPGCPSSGADRTSWGAIKNMF